MLIVYNIMLVHILYVNIYRVVVLSSAGASDIIGVGSGLQLLGGPIGLRT